MKMLCIVKKNKFPKMKDEDRIILKNIPLNSVGSTVLNNQLLELGLNENDVDFVADVVASSKDIENYIYSIYPAIKQSQDNGWVQNFTTKLNAGGVTSLDKQIVEFAISFLKDGKKLSEILVDVVDAIKPMYEKLVKVAVKNEWAYLVILEGKKAIAENREPVYPEFPKFD